MVFRDGCRGGGANSFGALFVARIMVGIGEATLSPVAISLIADYFAPERRGRPVSIFLMRQSIGGGASIALVGWLLAIVAAGLFIGWPVLDGMAGWRVAFIVCGMLGVDLAALLLTTREPPRTGVVAPTRQLRSVTQFFLENWKTFLPHYLSFSCISLAYFALISWIPTVLIRVFDLSATHTGAMLGSALIVGGIIGALSGGFLFDFVSRRFGIHRVPRLLAATMFLLVPSALVVLLPDAQTATLIAVFSCGCFPIIGTTAVTLTQAMVLPEMRGISISLIGLFATLIGFTFGPLLVARLTERVFADPQSVGVSLMIVMVPAVLIAASLVGLVAYRIECGLLRTISMDARKMIALE